MLNKMPQLPTPLVGIILGYLPLLSDEDYKDLLAFLNKPLTLSNEMHNTIFTFLLCLKILTGKSKSSDITKHSILKYAKPETLIELLSKDKNIKQYFAESLYNLGSSKDILENKIIQSLANEFHLLDSEDYFLQIKNKLESGNLRIDEKNIKSIIQILQLPPLDLKKIEVIQEKIAEIIHKIKQIDTFSNKKSMVSYLAFGLILIGLGIGSFFLKNTAIEVIGCFLILIGISANIVVIQERVLSCCRTSKMLTQYGWGGIKKHHLQFLFPILKEIKEHYTKIYDKKLNLNLDEYSSDQFHTLYDWLQDINNAISEPKQEEKKSYAYTLRYRMFTNYFPEIQQDVKIDLMEGFNIQQPNKDPNATEKSSLFHN